jgi:nucleoside permease NupC
MNPWSIIRSALLTFLSSVARNLLVTGMTWLVARNVIDAATSTQLVSILPVAVAAIAWSLIEKYLITKLHLEKLLAAQPEPPAEK